MKNIEKGKLEKGKKVVKIKVENIEKALTKPQLKNALKAYLDPLIKVSTVLERLQGNRIGIEKVMENAPAGIHECLLKKYNDLTIAFSELNMKKYLNSDYNGPAL
jgi:hypothetical protein